MPKYLFFSDGHLSGKNSINRLGNYFSDWLIKFDELLSIAVKNDCDAILDGGDLLHTKNPSYSVLDTLADRIENAKIDIISLLGNHCQESGHIENSQNTGLHHLQKRSKYFHYLNRKKYLGNALKKYDIIGIDYKFGIEEELKIPMNFEDKDAWNILITHALITPNKFFDNVSHVIPKQVKTNANIVLCTHYHIPFVKQIKNTTFINIGCFGRLSINEADIKPSVLLLDTEKRSYEIIKLKSAKKAKNIFDLDKYQELKGQKKDIAEFLNALKDINFQGMDLGEQIVKIGKDQKIEQNIIDYMLDKLKELGEKNE